MTAAELIASFDWQKLNREAVVVQEHVFSDDSSG